MEKKLYRDEYHKKLAGVCAGLAEYLTVDVAVVRILFVLACILHGGGLIVYIVLWIALPKKPYAFFDPTVDYKVPPENPGTQATGSANSGPYGSNPFQGTSFGSNPYPPNPPFQPQHRSTSLVAIIIGVVLIVIGGSILLDNFNIIPDWDLEHLWPIILIAVGCVLMLSGERKKPLNSDWQKTDSSKSATNNSETNTSEGNTSETNPPR